MKKKILAIVVSVLALAGFSYGQQKYCFVDTDYILAQSADYQAAQTTLNDLSVQWQKEVEAKYAEIDALYKNYQAEQLLLTDELRTKREAEIVQKEKDAKDYQKEKFGVDGELFKKRQELVKPIQDQVFNAVNDFATKGGYAVIFDKAGDGTTVLYLNPKLDKSDEILDLLGWKKGSSTTTTTTSGSGGK